MKKAQIHMMETIAVLFIFFIMVFIGIIFYTNIMASKVTQKQEQFQELSTVQVAQIASSLSEFSCTKPDIVSSNCIDLLKLKYAKDIIDDNIGEYFDLFGYANITVKKIYPEGETYELYTYKGNLTSKSPTFFPISLYEPINETASFGLMTVEVYS